MCDIAQLTPLLEAAKKCLVATPWEKEEDDEAAQQPRTTTTKIKARMLSEPVAAAVLCELMEVRRLQRLLQAAAAQEEEWQRCAGEKASATSSLPFKAKPKRRHDEEKHAKGEAASVAATVLHCTLHHYLTTLKRCSPHVQSLYSACSPRLTKVSSSDLATDAADVLLVLVLCMAVALCEQRKQQQHQLASLSLRGAATATSSSASRQNRSGAGVVSSSQDTSAHSQGSSVFCEKGGSQTPPTRHHTSSGSVYTVIRDYYNVKSEAAASVVTAPREQNQQEGLRARLQRILPVLEARLPMTELWREPSLLAALDVMARGVWHAQARLHGSTEPHKVGSSGRCPLCYAAALNNDLAAEAITQLSHYYVIYHGEGDDEQRVAGEEGRSDVRNALESQADTARQQKEKHDDTSCLQMQARGWVAACRIAIWNWSGTTLACLMETRTAPWLIEAPLIMPNATHILFSWRREAADVLPRLWTCWWRAERALAETEHEKQSTASGDGNASPASVGVVLVSRGAGQRLHSCLLFLETLVPSSTASIISSPQCRSTDSGHNTNCGSRQRSVDSTQNAGADVAAAAAAVRAGGLEVLSWLLRLPLQPQNSLRTAAPSHLDLSLDAQQRQGPAALDMASDVAAVTGTLFHWLCAHNDLVLLRLFILQLSNSCTLLGRARPTFYSSNDASTAALQEKAKEAIASAQRVPHVVQLRQQQQQQHQVGHSSRGINANAPSPTSAGTLARIPVPDPTAATRFSCHNVRLTALLSLRDAHGRTALDVACHYGHVQCVRLLLQNGLSPNSLALRTLRTDAAAALPLPFLRLLYDPAVLDGSVSVGGHQPTSNAPRVSLADQLRSTRCPAAAARTLAQLAHRLWVEKAQQQRCPTMQAAEDASRSEAASTEATAITLEKPRPGDGCSYEAWCTAYLLCQAAQDRVLRPALAALAYDAHEPLARLVVVAVLTRKLMEWLTTTPPAMRSGENSSFPAATGVMSLRDLHLHHTVALRLYTQLTCPFGRRLLHDAVAIRSAICAAVELREERAAATLLSSTAPPSISTPESTAAPDEEGGAIGIKKKEDKAKHGIAERSDDGIKADKHGRPGPDGLTLEHQQQQQQLPLSEAAKARRELQALYANVIDGVQHLDTLLVAEQRRVTARAAAQEEQQRQCDWPQQRRRQSQDGEAALTGAATVLRGRRVQRSGGGSGDDDNSESDVPSYVLVVIPSILALQRARWTNNNNDNDVSSRSNSINAASTSNLSSCGCAVVEPTLWSPVWTPRQVWLQLPRGLHLDELLRSHGGCGYGVVSHDMPLVAPVQRGDLITFHHIKGSGSAAPQFVADAIFSEPRMLPYLTVTVKHPQQEMPYASPPTSLVLPFTHGPQSEGASTTPFSASPSPRSATATATQRSQQPRCATSVTLHACCLFSLYLEGTAGTSQPRDDEVPQPHPLDWLQARPSVSSGSESKGGKGVAADADVLAVLRTQPKFLSLWLRLVWTGVQPCWLASVREPTNAGGAQAERSSALDRNGRHTPALVHLFGTDDHDEEVATMKSAGDDLLRGAVTEKRLLTVRLASAVDAGEEENSVLVSDWPSRADAWLAKAASADYVVDVTL